MPGLWSSIGTLGSKPDFASLNFIRFLGSELIDVDSSINCVAQRSSFTNQIQTVDSQTSLSSVIINNRQNITSILFSENGVRFSQWIRNGAEMQRHYSAIWILLPVGSIFITALVVLLMVMFNRCPQMIAAFVTGILGIIIVFIILMSLDHRPVYS